MDGLAEVDREIPRLTGLARDLHAGRDGCSLWSAGLERCVQDCLLNLDRLNTLNMCLETAALREQKYRGNRLFMLAGYSGWLWMSGPRTIANQCDGRPSRIVITRLKQGCIGHARSGDELREANAMRPSSCGKAHNLLGIFGKLISMV